MRAYFFILFPLLLFGNISVETNSRNLCVINASTGNVIYQKNMHQKIYPGSVTKVATGLFLIEECDLDEEYVVTCLKEALIVTTEKKRVAANFSQAPYILEDDGVSIYLKSGERLKLIDLLHACLVRSANDASNVLASVYGKSIPDFMFKVNQFLRGIGCKNTHFVNPHGLHHPDHVTTPHDLALMVKRASAHPLLKKLMSTSEYTMERTNLSAKRSLVTGNKLIIKDGKYFTPSVIGGKTGYHRRARYNIALFAKKNGRSVVMAVNKSESRKTLFDDCKKVLSAVFEEEPKERILFNSEESEFFHSFDWANQKLTASLKEDCILKYYPSEEEPLDVKIHWFEKEGFIAAGEVVGTIDIYNEHGVPVLQQDIYAQNDVDYSFGKKVSIVLNWMIKVVATYPLTTILILFIFFFVILPRRKKRVI
jgi:serine-type D-Ala-D-Ala carboxypeptidase (penicillin-binding protein 5/6)